MRAYATQGDVQAALLDGSLDLAYGLNAFSPSGFFTLATRDTDSSLTAHVANFDLNTRMIAMHSGGALNTSSLRKRAMCIMNRAALYQGELVEEQPIDTLFDPNLPYMSGAVPSLTPIADLCASSTSSASDITQNLRFLYYTGSAHIEGIVYFLIGELAAAGISVTPIPLPKDQYNGRLGAWAGSDGAAYTADDWPTWPLGQPDLTTPNWDIAYAETWGPMYDPTSTLSDIAYTWPAEVWSEATNYLETISKSDLNTRIQALSQFTSDTARQNEYTSLFNTLNEEAIFLPLTAKRNTAVLNNRHSGFVFGTNEYGTAATLSSLRPAPPPSPPSSSDDGLSSGSIAGIVIGCIVGTGLLLFVIILIASEKNGKPIFMTINASSTPTYTSTAEKAGVEKSSV